MKDNDISVEGPPPIVVPPVRLDSLSRERLEEMADAGAEIVDCIRVLARSKDNLVSEVLHGEPDFVQWVHYPKGDVYDPASASQYYYHAHPPGERPEEHGHFHTFLRPRGMPEGVRPAPVPDYAAPDDPDDALSHLVAFSMNEYGLPIALFTTNRWVTGETWYSADDVVGMLDRFEIDLARPGSWPVNRWITAMFSLFRPQITALIGARDDAVAAWTPAEPGLSVYEDRLLEVTSQMPVSIDDQIAAVAAALERA